MPLGSTATKTPARALHSAVAVELKDRMGVSPVIVAVGIDGGFSAWISVRGAETFWTVFLRRLHSAQSAKLAGCLQWHEGRRRYGA